jgi:hypothetical protein
MDKIRRVIGPVDFSIESRKTDKKSIAVVGHSWWNCFAKTARRSAL